MNCTAETAENAEEAKGDVLFILSLIAKLSALCILAWKRLRMAAVLRCRHS